MHTISSFDLRTGRREGHRTCISGTRKYSLFRTSYTTVRNPTFACALYPSRHSNVQGTHSSSSSQGRAGILFAPSDSGLCEFARTDGLVESWMKRLVRCFWWRCTWLVVGLSGDPGEFGGLGLRDCARAREMEYCACKEECSA